MKQVTSMPAGRTGRSGQRAAWLAASAVIPISILCSGAAAAAPALLRFWNLTSTTITELYVAPSGTGHWSKNLCLTDPDRSVDPDERLNFGAIPGGMYDVRLVDQSKRKCTLHDVAIRVQGAYAFSVSEEQMKACAAHPGA